MLTAPVAEAVEIPIREWTPHALEEFSREKAREYGIDEEVFVSVMKCESMNFTHNGQSFVVTKDGSREDSWGIPQIHAPSHPTISREQALDPVFALDWAAKEFSKGNAKMWSCYTKRTPAIHRGTVPL